MINNLLIKNVMDSPETSTEIVNILHMIKIIETESIQNLNNVSIDQIDNVIFLLDAQNEKFKQLPNYNQIDILLRGFLATLKKELMAKSNQVNTKWDVLLDDLLKKEKLDEIKTLVTFINEHKNIQISEKDIKVFKKLFNLAIDSINSELSPFDKKRTLIELTKKEKTFMNRNERVIENGFGPYIKHLRKSKGYSLKDLEDASGITASYIYRLENGDRKTPSIPIIKKLAVGLGISPSAFIQKLNETTDDTQEVLSLNDVISFNNFSINGVLADKEHKERLLDILNTILAADWSSESKLMDSMKIAQLIDEFKKNLQ